ncbi:MAG: transcription antitermination factor NusB [Planctomycetota bacterium]|jgi:16S rRNA (cytosine967-C5)-methyltransferase
MAPAPNSARKTAWLVLNQCDIARHDTAELLNKYLPQSDRPAQATDIVFGVIRNQTLIDLLISKCGSIEQSRVKPSLWNLLRIGVYELVYAPKTAEYAIINEAVELAAQKGTRKTSGFANAVLRSVQKCIESRQSEIKKTKRPITVPQTLTSGCVLALNLLPDPELEPADYLSKAFSLPNRLTSEWLSVYDYETTEQICFASNRHPSVTLQPNTLRTDAEQLHQKLTDQGFDCEINPVKTTCSLKHAGKINKIPEFLDGLFLIQDSTAAEAMNIVDAKPGWTIADLCAAPGGKCISLAMQMNDEGLILASDIDKKRLKKVTQNVKRMGINCVEVVSPEHIEQKIQKCHSLDAVVLDVPCSNTGVLAKRVEARHRLGKNHLQGLLKAQRRLLEQAVTACQQQTKIVYSTCSIQPQENQQQIQQFLSQHPQFTLIAERLTLPGLKTDLLFDHDGGYVAVLQQK